MKPFAQLALLASTLLLGTIHAQTALRVDLEQDQPINAQVLVRLAPTQSLGQQPANSVQLENTAQQQDFPTLIALELSLVLPASTLYLVLHLLKHHSHQSVQAAQGVRLCRVASVPLAVLVHGQLLALHLAHLVLLVVTALVLQINAQVLVQLEPMAQAMMLNVLANAPLVNFPQTLVPQLVRIVHLGIFHLPAQHLARCAQLVPFLLIQMERHHVQNAPPARLARLLASHLQSVQVQSCAHQVKLPFPLRLRQMSLLQRFAPVVLLVNMLQLARPLALIAPLDASVLALMINALVLAGSERTLSLVLQHALLVQLESLAWQSD